MSLNVGSLTGNGKHLDTIIEIPHIAEINKDKYAQCHRFRCKPILPRAGTFYVRCQSIFGSWEKALKSININYEEIKRKDAKRDSEYYLLKLGEIVKNNPGWTVKSIKNSNHSIYRGIYNLERRGLLRFLDKFEGNDVMKAAIFEEQFISSNTQLDINDYCTRFKDEFENDWRSKNRRCIDDEQRKRGHAFEKWFKQSLIMNGFSELTEKDESLLSDTNFIHEKHFFSIEGDSKEYRKPDFLFKDMIIDTKTTFTEDEKTIQQFKAYSTIRKNLYCVTLRQDSIKKFPDDNFEVTLVCIDNIDTKIPMLMDCHFDEDLLERHLDNVLQDVIKD